MQVYAVIVAGGTGSRMNATIPKQLMLIEDKPIIYHCISAFLAATANINFVVVCHADFKTDIMNALKDFAKANISFCTGGNTRYESVQLGLQLCADDSIVLVHDAVRCLASPTLINAIINNAMQYGNAIPFIDVKDSMRIVDNKGNRAIDRDCLKIVQTPQGFKTNIIKPIFKQVYQSNFTDEATVCELSGIDIHLIEGEETNIKITYPTDLIFASSVLSKKI